MNRFLNIKQLSEIIGLAEQTIYNRVNTGGDLPSTLKLGRSLRWRESDVEEWMNSKQPMPAKLNQASVDLSSLLTKRRRGRPNKAEQHAARQRGNCQDESQ
ncbi:helix-turn-helix transcriptional regulator [Deefgea rivuli]|uniref:helix-turn-helix transcriptional regulator n=1 Tax=Deefgea rivuli TaxID=400948 RepID=UPI00056A08A4|nr:helix-turn-helix domain-containing protein [Deefgea rivuli]